MVDLEHKRALARERMRRYRAAHPEQERERARLGMQKWREANRETDRERKRADHQKHKVHNNARRRQWRHDHLEYSREANRQWQADHPGYNAQNAKEWRAQRWIEAVNNPEAITLRAEACEICGTVCKTCFDHCHEQRIFRGWLCTRCNRTLGFVKDDPALLTAMASYVRKFRGGE